MDHDNPAKWQRMFDRDARDPEPGRAMGGAPPMARDEPADDGPPDLDVGEYKPWVLQRGRSRPVLMLHLRRFEPKSGLWMGWQLAYPHLVAAEYIGDKMLSLDFGARQFMIEGEGLDDLARHLQQGTVLAVQEYNSAIWTARASGHLIRAIKRLGAATAPISEG